MTIAQLAPQSTRELRALELHRTRGHEIREISPNVYEVPSCSGAGSYTVEYGGVVESCDCPDAEFHPEFSCKHILAVAIRSAKRRRPRTYRQHVEAARRDAAESYREECRSLMRAGLL